MWNQFTLLYHGKLCFIAAILYKGIKTLPWSQKNNYINCTFKNIQSSLMDSFQSYYMGKHQSSQKKLNMVC